MDKMGIKDDIKINVLGTEYTVSLETEAENEKLEDANGLCSGYAKKIIIKDLSKTELWKDAPTFDIDKCQKTTLRHEIIHAFIYESGLDGNSLDYDDGWATNEEMVEWFAIQSPKLLAVFNQLEVI